ncbi:MAG TPA: AraC family transcriptional regulator [Dyella sp.]|uniref:AraC family transcriptional regulator n=1 Tax=Dyella sp. TaxID=1869338 RepID=UPI002D773647|nr:AraC family transcriptional regulator [Dyella sp.]HET6554218.1 AraC family transcriptional regulator [Dyella sp.]
MTAPAVRHAAAIHRERTWRQLDMDVEQSGQPVIASHWSDHRAAPREYNAQSPRGYYVASIFMRPTQLALSADAQDVHHGEWRSGSFHMSAPGQQLHARFESPCEILHLHLSEAFVRRMAVAADSLHLIPAPAITHVAQDAVIEQLGRALLAADDKMCGWQYAERVATPIITRYFHLLAQAQLHGDQPRRIALPRWRLQRVHDYVQNHLSGSITLADMASAAGLSAMHFAAQFRIATGQRPHDYLLQCRIDRAKSLLATNSRALIDVTLEVGFCTQAHFTTVFKRFTGTTPNLWRRQHLHSLADDAEPVGGASIHNLHLPRTS